MVPRLQGRRGGGKGCYRALRFGSVPIAVAILLSAGLQPARAQFACDSEAAGESGDGALAFGSPNNFACGTDAKAFRVIRGNTGHTAVGVAADASSLSGDGANTAIGYSANASGDVSRNTATGDTANASGSRGANTATGAGADAHGAGSSNVAMGRNANASGDFTLNTAVGAFATATGANASAFGTGATATHANSAAFGQGATTTRDNQQVFGTATNTYTMTGITSDQSKAAQGAPTHIVTSNAGGDLAAHTIAELGLATTSDISGLQSQINGLARRDKELVEGIAMAFAMAGVPTVLPHETIVLTANWGTFEGENAFAAAAAVRLNQNLQLNGGIAASTSGNTLGGRVGVRVGY